MGQTTRWVDKEARGAKTDGTYGTNVSSLRIDTRLAGGTLIKLLAPGLITEH
jgi:hypothetical protein